MGLGTFYTLLQRILKISLTDPQAAHVYSPPRYAVPPVINRK